ncbi:biopolymer transport protein ExbB [Idiomarina loihiensis]|uniref:MotA/TolQ/ExbB proton channel family protein n=1 Tax=Idiomarina TaxID=135575 RepID=UPI000D70FA72|nr:MULTISPECIES: MotA/TolQ/ExbB proton channel family protein [Idiomarina]PWW36969.1 biopolymer transport protein ExbB [Idiomarina loihiensis]TDP46777.1 biopolymer transport protein ExbB [Idiomarina loihiensis]TDS23048.1 biopolymer transport protein ExbB [Idiomarina sp. H2]
MPGSFYSHLLAHPLSWLLLGLAFSSYARLIYIRLSAPSKQLTQRPKITTVPAIVVTALPLIGLLGTIMGMQTSFSALVNSSSTAYTVTNGVSQALMTTLLGIALAIPGWLLLWSTKAKIERKTMESLGEFVNQA